MTGGKAEEWCNGEGELEEFGVRLDAEVEALL